MRKFLLALVAGTALASPAMAADYAPPEPLLALVVSGMAESRTGITFLGDVDFAPYNKEPRDDNYFSSGYSARLSLPLATWLTFQTDVDFDYNTNWIWEDNKHNRRDNFYGTTMQWGGHLSARDPYRGLIGAFGGWGTGDLIDRNDTDTRVWFAGGEVQGYFGDWTLYGQAGYFDAEQDNWRNTAFRDAFFGRGVARWFFAPNGRLQIEGAYADGVADWDKDDQTLWEAGIRFDSLLSAVPIIGGLANALVVIGDPQVYAGYRFNYIENEGSHYDESFSTHTVLIGARFAFGGGTLREFDQVGASLDLPGVTRWSLSGDILD